MNLPSSVTQIVTGGRILAAEPRIWKAASLLDSRSAAKEEGLGRKLEPRVRVSGAGFSVLELLISFAILLIATMIAGRLLLEAQARMSHSARQALEPVTDIALKQIRADVRASGRVPALDHEWSWGPLVLLDHPAGTVVYERTDGNLVRTVDSGGSEPGERIVMRSVSIWRWRLAPGVPLPLVEIELGRREISHFARLAAAGQREAPIPVTRSHFLAISPRQIGKRGW